MMKKFIILFIVPLLVFNCESEKNSKKAGTETIYSDKVSNPGESEGFSVEKASIITFPNSNQILPDFKLRLRTSSEEYYASFVALTNKPTFVFIDSIPTSYDAKIKFRNFSKTNYEFQSMSTSQDLTENSIWLVRGVNSTLYKILILEINIYENPDHEQNISILPVYGNVTFQWEIL